MQDVPINMGGVMVILNRLLCTQQIMNELMN